MSSGILDRIKRRRPAVYTDFNASFEANPLTGDIQMISDEKAIAQNLKFLILTNTGERLFQPEVGGDMYRNLFKLITPATITLIKEKVKDIVTNYEPRVELIDVDVVAYDHQINVTIFYALRSREDTLQTTVVIQRDR